MTPILLRNDTDLSVSLAPSAHEAKANALALAALIGKVTNPDENEAAVEAQKAIKELVDAAEHSHKEIKRPVIDCGRQIDNAKNQFVKELKDEYLRLARLGGDYQTLQQAKARAAEAAQRAQLEEIERRKQEELANAQSHDQLDEIQARYNEEAAAIPAPTSTKAQGQVVKMDWEITVSDIYLLVKAHPACVKIEPRLSEIKALLNAGVKVAGVVAKPITNATVRLSREPKALTI